MMIAHPWHGLSMGEESPASVNVVVEAPRNTTTKYELNPDTGLLHINRIMHPPVTYPANYGFIPQTLDDDGDPLDALVLMQNATHPLTVLLARPVGMVSLTDRGENDDKIICVHINDPMYERIEAFDDLSIYEQEMLDWFFSEYKDAMSRDVQVDGFQGAEEAQAAIERCAAFYREAFPEE